MNEYATLTRKEELREAWFDNTYGEELNALDEVKKIISSRSFTTLEEDVVLAHVERAIEELEEKRND
jgi:hypothetical protein